MSDPQKRKPRSDALKNRERLIESAKDVLGKGGPDASLEAVAKQAGVGIGTLYRHFPTREALFNAVFSRDLTDLVEIAESLDADDDTVEALRRWLRSNVSMVETKRGMLGALSVIMTEDSRKAYDAEFALIRAALHRVIARGVAAGQLRPGFSPDDLMQTIYAICYARQPGPGWRENVLRLLDIFIDGLRA